MRKVRSRLGYVLLATAIVLCMGGCNGNTATKSESTTVQEQQDLQQELTQEPTKEIAKELEPTQQPEPTLEPTQAVSDESGIEKKHGTIEIIDKIYSPETGHDNKVRIYLPIDYEKETKSYPVIYMTDAQNLYDANVAAFGMAWMINDILDNQQEQGRTEGVIVVGVDAPTERESEYNLFIGETEEGKCNQTCEFFAKTLKPYIDENYRTLSDKEHTAFIGASYGSIVSFNSIRNYPDIYGYAGIFSFCNVFLDDVVNETFTPEKVGDIPLYFFTGTKDFCCYDTKTAYETAKKNGLEKILYTETKDGDHNEYNWRSGVVECLEFWQWLK